MLVGNPDATLIYVFCCITYILILIFIFTMCKAAKDIDEAISKSIKKDK